MNEKRELYVSLFVVLKADRWCGIEQIVWYEK